MGNVLIIGCCCSTSTPVWKFKISLYHLNFFSLWIRNFGICTVGWGHLWISQVTDMEQLARAVVI